MIEGVQGFPSESASKPLRRRIRPLCSGMRDVAAAVLIVAAVAVFRLAGPLAGGETALLLANISPLAAVVVGGAIYMPRRAAFMVPFGALFVSTLVVNAVRGWPLVSPYTAVVALCFALVFGLAWLVRGTRRVSAVLGVTVAGTVVFYVLSNTVAWFFEPAYAPSAAGWLQAQTVGLPIPGAPPAWWFFAKSLAGDLLFSSLMIAICHPRAQRATVSGTVADIVAPVLAVESSVAASGASAGVSSFPVHS